MPIALAEIEPDILIKHIHIKKCVILEIYGTENYLKIELL